MPTGIGMQTPTDIANTALGHIGSVQEIQNLTDDQTQEARVMRRFYDDTLVSLLNAYNWNFCKVYQQLQIAWFYLTPEWAFGYQYPTGCIQIRRIYNFRHTDDIDSVIEYTESNDGTQRLILSNFGPNQVLPTSGIYVPTKNTSNYPTTIDPSQIPIMEFTQFVNNVSLMPAFFKEAFAFVLAAKASPSIPGVGQGDLRKENLQLGNAALSQAAALDMNATKIMPERKSLIERAGKGEIVRLSVNGSLTIPENYPQ